MEEEPAKLAQKDRDARWTVKQLKAKVAADRAWRIDIAIPMFGYRNHISTNRKQALIRTSVATDAARHDGAQLPNLLSKENTDSDVWADTAYRSQKNEDHLEKNDFKSRAHRKKIKGKQMSDTMRQANDEKSKVRSRVVHVLDHEKGPLVLVIRTIGLS